MENRRRYKTPVEIMAGFNKNPSDRREGDDSRRDRNERPAFDRKPRTEGNDRGGSDRPRRTFGDKPSFDRPRSNGGGFGGGDRKPFGDKPAFDRPRRDDNRSGGGFGGGDRKPFGDKPSFDRPRRDDNRSGGGDRKPFGGKPSFDNDRPRRDDNFDRRPKFQNDDDFFGKSERPAFDKDEQPRNVDQRSYSDRSSKPRREGSTERNARQDTRNNDRQEEDYDRNTQFVNNDSDFFEEKEAPRNRPRFDENAPNDKPRFEDHFQFTTSDRPVLKNNLSHERTSSVEDDDMRLNKYVALSGLASRRAAAEMIKNGDITVNDEVVKEPGYRVQQNDVIKHKSNVLSPVVDLVYLLLNKPKNIITTMNDEQGRKTVMDVVVDATDKRIYPVGRLDRDTTGLLVLTNDGDLARKLSHPSNDVKKIYQVTLDRPVSDRDIEAIQKGLELEDGRADVDAVGHVEGGKNNEIGIEIHIGKNRIVRRIFEHLGYTVEKLDRVYYAGLTKKDLPRGRYRNLTEKEVIMLKHFS